MFQHPEADAAGASNVPPSSNPQPRPERVRHVLYGSLQGLDRTIKILHSYGYSDPNDWCDPIPVPPTNPASPEERSRPSQWMVVMDKLLLLE